MTGVEILATNECVTAYGFSWNIFLVVFLVLTILFTLLIGFALLCDYGWRSFLYGFIGSLILGAVFGGLGGNKQKPLEYETQYKVTISDEVSMNEFLDKYEIVSQEGKIYTVREAKDD